MISAIVTGITTLATSVFSNWAKTREAKNAMKLAELKNKARLLADKQSNNHSWEMANLTDKDKWLRRASFVMFISPFVVAIFSPEHVRLYFEQAIAAVPNWWQETFVAINGAIWAISSLKNTIVSFVGEMRKEK